MRKLFGFVTGFWCMFTTEFLLFWSALKSTTCFDNHPYWFGFWIFIVWIFGISSTMMCFEAGFPQRPNPKSKRRK